MVEKKNKIVKITYLSLVLYIFLFIIDGLLETFFTFGIMEFVTILYWITIILAIISRQWLVIILATVFWAIMFAVIFFFSEAVWYYMLKWFNIDISKPGWWY